MHCMGWLLMVFVVSTVCTTPTDQEDHTRPTPSSTPLDAVKVTRAFLLQRSQPHDFPQPRTTNKPPRQLLRRASTFVDWIPNTARGFMNSLRFWRSRRLHSQSMDANSLDSSMTTFDDNLINVRHTKSYGPDRLLLSVSIPGGSPPKGPHSAPCPGPDVDMKLRMSLTEVEKYTLFFDLDRYPLLRIDEADKEPNILNQIEFTPFGMISLKEIVARTETSTIHAIRDYPSVVVKYQIDCHNDKYLEYEYIVMHAIQPLGISPRAYYLSKPSFQFVRELWRPDYPKTYFKTRPSASCAGKPVQFIIMDATGSDLAIFAYAFSASISLRDIGIVGRKLIALLQILHEEGQHVHGDIHPGNVAFRHPLASSVNRDFEQAELVLIDFGRSYNIDSPLVTYEYQENHALLSQWEMSGFHSTQRDDVFRAIMIIAAMVAGPNLTHKGLYQFFENRNHMKSECYSIKESANLFTFLRDPLYGLAPSVRDEMNHVFDQILLSVRAREEPAAIPNYEELITLFEQWVRVTDITAEH